MSKLITGGIEDIRADPKFEKKCAVDIHTYCKDLPKKNGNG